MRVIKLFISTFMPSVVKPLHALWNEILAFIFFALAIMLGFGPVRRGYQELNGEIPHFIKFAAAVFVAVLMLWFAVQSFRRARHISRS